MSGSSSGTPSNADGGEDESIESSLSAFKTMPNNFRSALDEFRTNWQHELKQQKQPTTTSDHSAQPEQTPVAAKQKEDEEENLDVLAPLSSKETEEQALARNLFHKAVELEQRGKVYDAIPFYRKAVQIEPNIEFKYYEQQKIATSAKLDLGHHTKLENASTGAVDHDVGEASDESELPEELYEKFQMELSRSGKLIASSRDPGIITTEMHISNLPPELILYILRWVVSSQLDLRSLEQCAAVCKGMFLCARDEELWRLACVKVWGHNLGSLTTHSHNDDYDDTITSDQSPIIPRYSSWRQMFIERERVLFNGCYISKTKYIRMGENSFQDQYYRPVQLVEYYRYLRFLPDGSVLMMTNADEPTQGVNRLKNLNQLRPDILRGHYRLFGSTLNIILNKQAKSSTLSNIGSTYVRHRRGSSIIDESSYTSTKYCLEFRILNTTKRKYAQLAWLKYSIVQTRNKHETTSEFDLTPSKYPPLWFSPVKSYHLDADAPLN